MARAALQAFSNRAALLGPMDEDGGAQAMGHGIVDLRARYIRVFSRAAGSRPTFSIRRGRAGRSTVGMTITAMPWAAKLVYRQRCADRSLVGQPAVLLPQVLVKLFADRGESAHVSR